MIEFNLSKRTKAMPDLKSGDVVKVYRIIKEGEKERTQIFEGMIIAIKGRQSSSPMITVRKVSFGVGSELMLPIYSPNIEKIEIVKRASLKRAKLYYMREKTIKSLRLKYKDLTDFIKGEAKEEVLENESAPIEKKEEAAVTDNVNDSATPKKEIENEKKADEK